MPKTSTHVLLTLRKHTIESLKNSFEDSCGNRLDSFLIMSIKSLHFCSEACVCVPGVKSQPFIVGCDKGVLSPLFFIVYISGFQSGPCDPQSGDKPFWQGSWADILCTQPYCICFIWAFNGGC